MIGHLGPVIFEPYAADLARRVAAARAAPVLEVACGTGILTQQLRALVSHRPVGRHRPEPANDRLCTLQARRTGAH